jgi:hypothetical protein
MSPVFNILLSPIDIDRLHLLGNFINRLLGDPLRLCLHIPGLLPPLELDYQLLLFLFISHLLNLTRGQLSKTLILTDIHANNALTDNSIIQTFKIFIKLQKLLFILLQSHKTHQIHLRETLALIFLFRVMILPHIPYKLFILKNLI